MPDLTDSTAKITPAVVALRKRIRQHLVEIEAASWAGDNPDPVEWRAEVIDDVALDELAARLLADLDVERLRGIEQRAREYVEAVDRGRQLGVANLGRPILQFQPLRAALGIGPFLGDDDDQ